jgi:hypothetical protein
MAAAELIAPGFRGPIRGCWLEWELAKSMVEMLDFGRNMVLHCLASISTNETICNMSI